MLELHALLQLSVHGQCIVGCCLLISCSWLSLRAVSESDGLQPGPSSIELAYTWRSMVPPCAICSTCPSGAMCLRFGHAFIPIPAATTWPLCLIISTTSAFAREASQVFVKLIRQRLWRCYKASNERWTPRLMSEKVYDVTNHTLPEEIWQ